MEITVKNKTDLNLPKQILEIAKKSTSGNVSVKVKVVRIDEVEIDLPEDELNTLDIGNLDLLIGERLSEMDGEGPMDSLILDSLLSVTDAETDKVLFDSNEKSAS